MRDGAAKGGLFGQLDIGVQFDRIAGQGRELVDHVLRDQQPVRHPDFGADRGLDGFAIIDWHCLSPLDPRLHTEHMFSNLACQCNHAAGMAV